MRAAAVCLFSLLVGTPAVFAQSDAPRGRVSGVLGAGRTWDDEGSIGTGVGGGGRVEWRLFGNTGIEGAVDGLTHVRRGGFFQSEGTSTILSVSLRHRFGPDIVTTYILEGVDLVRHSGTTRIDNVTFGNKSTSTGFHFGVGLAVRVADRLEIGPEARFYILRPDNDSDPAWANWIGARLGVRF